MRGINRARAVRLLADMFRDYWPAYRGLREQAYRALACRLVPVGLIADAAGVSRRTVRTAIRRPGPIAVEVWRVSTSFLEGIS